MTGAIADRVKAQMAAERERLMAQLEELVDGKLAEAQAAYDAAGAADSAAWLKLERTGRTQHYDAWLKANSELHEAQDDLMRALNRQRRLRVQITMLESDAVLRARVAEAERKNGGNGASS